MRPDHILNPHAFKILEEPGAGLELDHAFLVLFKIIVPIEKVLGEGIEIQSVRPAAFLADVFEFGGQARFTHSIVCEEEHKIISTYACCAFPLCRFLSAMNSFQIPSKLLG